MNDRLSRVIASASICCIALCLGPDWARGQSGSRPLLSVSIVEPAAPLPLTDRLRVQIVLKDISDEPVIMGFRGGNGSGETPFKAELTASDGTRVPRWPEVATGTQLDHQDGASNPFAHQDGASYPIIMLDPGETMKSYIYLKSVFKIMAPGTYSLHVSIFDPKSHSKIESNTVTLNLVTGGE
jgi:hypothetical protein